MSAFPRQVPGIPRTSEHHELSEDVLYDHVAGVPLREAGKAADLLILEGAPHGFQTDWRGEFNRRSNPAIDVFLEQHLGVRRSSAATAQPSVGL